VVDDPVDHCPGNDLVGEGISPTSEWQIAGEDHSGVFVFSEDESGDQVRGVLAEWKVSNFINDQERVAA
jgi:hypothetical protein